MKETGKFNTKNRKSCRTLKKELSTCATYLNFFDDTCPEIIVPPFYTFLLFTGYQSTYPQSQITRKWTWHLKCSRKVRGRERVLRATDLTRPQPKEKGIDLRSPLTLTHKEKMVLCVWDSFGVIQSETNLSKRTPVGTIHLVLRDHIKFHSRKGEGHDLLTLKRSDKWLSWTILRSSVLSVLIPLGCY